MLVGDTSPSTTKFDCLWTSEYLSVKNYCLLGVKMGIEKNKYRKYQSLAFGCLALVICLIML